MPTGLDWGGRRLTHREHLVFGVALVLLVALAVWWSRTLSGLVTSEYELGLVGMQGAAWEQASMLQNAEIGAVHGDFVVVGGDAMRGPCVPLAGGALALCPTAEALADAATRYQRRRAMVQGESGFLLLLLLVCVFMLYRLVVAERRFRAEIEFFLGVVTHEMKTPLASLKALLQTIQRGRVPAEQLPELLGLGLEQLRREEQLVGNLLRLQRMRVATSSMEAVPVLVRPLLEAQARERSFDGISRVVLRVEGEPTVLGDLEGLRSILDNLVDNAAKFSEGPITLAAATRAGEVILTVSDEGRGFTADEEPTLFVAFRRNAGENGTGPSGTGLGLFLSRQLAERMGGALEAHSPGFGRGATFTLRLRAAEGQ